MPIRRLAEHVINQIAAGEVVERPASVAKEVIENAIDAGATRIDVRIEGGGIDLLEVLDDGGGMPAHELPLAVAPHATSKVDSAEDLQHIATMGFRGEALASIGSVARLEIRSRIASDDSGSMIVVDHGAVEEVQPVACPTGTRVTMRGLFARVPARRRFLKRPQAETSRVRRVVRDLAVANPEVAFRLVSQERTMLDLPATNQRGRFIAAMGSELTDELLEVDQEREGIRVLGLVGSPATARPTSAHQVICLNGRPLIDRSIRHAIKEAYRGLIESSRHPTVALLLEVPPDRVDVNVHPAKTEVRFRDDRLVYSIVRRGIEAALAKADLTPAMRPTGGDGPWAPPAERALFGPRDRTSTQSKSSPSTQRFDVPAARAAMGTGTQAPEYPVEVIEAAQPVVQIHQTFLVTQDAEGLLIIDQHALHERVMFEKLMDRLDAGPLPSQRLLMPEMVEASSEAIEAVDSIGPLIERLGFDLTAAGPDVVAVHAVPSLLTERRVSIGGFVSDLLERAGELGSMTDTETAAREVLDMMACKAAIKAGDALTHREMADLVSMRERVERSSNCPHGRPTTLRLSIDELERRFGRR
ncbi:MAG: DNA mismatch repair endonuclease MutL [Phycisphaerales bacterium]|nr:DNA mismatch repair endonuclease MutL [Phycisphaerales bacterium]